MRTLALLIVTAAASVPALTLAQAGSASPDASPPQSKAAEPDPDQRIRCRIVNVTGSMVKGGRVCRTVAEWRATMDNNNALARKMVEDNTGRPPGN